MVTLMAKDIGQDNLATSGFTSLRSERMALCKSAFPLFPGCGTALFLVQHSVLFRQHPTLSRPTHPQSYHSIPAGIWHCDKLTAKDLGEIPDPAAPGSTLWFWEAMAERTRVLEKANMQVEGVKRNFCHSFKEKSHPRWTVP